MVKNVIYKLRKDANKTQQEIAEKMNKSVSAYSRLENGLASVLVEDIISLSKIYNISVADLMNQLQHPHIITTLHPDKNAAEAWTLERMQQQIETHEMEIRALHTRIDHLLDAIQEAK